MLPTVVSCSLLFLATSLPAVSGMGYITAELDFESTTFVPYYTYAGNLSVSGMVTGTVDGTTVTLTAKLYGADPACVSGPSDAPNSCGAHFHFARTCSGDGLGHFFTGAVTEDPWIDVAYAYAMDGATMVGATLDIGATLETLESDWFPLAFLIHGFDGGRIACALLVSEYEAPIATGFVPYFNYEGDLEVSGLLTISTSGTTQTGTYSFEGVDPACSSGADLDTPNSCGVHVHAGTTCTGDGLGHYFTGDVTEDPWITTSYTSVDGAAEGSFVVDTGATEDMILGRAFVVHAYDGSRVACAIIQ